MNCYFCQQECLPQGGHNDLDPINWICKNCVQPIKNGTMTVFISPGRLVCHKISKTDDLLFVHIYLDYTAYPERGRNYHVRLHLQEGYTQIWEAGIRCLLQFPGFPINPTNAEQKLKLYLLFS
jgi:hypothetical protein